jgi:CDP-diglyceride synthetase
MPFLRSVGDFFYCPINAGKRYDNAVESRAKFANGLNSVFGIASAMTAFGVTNFYLGVALSKTATSPVGRLIASTFVSVAALVVVSTFMAPLLNELESGVAKAVGHKDFAARLDAQTPMRLLAL